MLSAIYPTEPIYQADTWPGVPGIILQINGAPPGYVLASARLIFYKAEDGHTPPALTLSTPDKILILDASDWELKIPPTILALPPGEWSFRFTTTGADAGATVRTWFVGTLSIH